MTACGRLLLVDDDPPSLELLNFLFRSDFEVMTVSSAEQALAALEGFRPDMILLDLRMPRMDGWALAQYLSSDPRSKEAKLVAVSACAFPADKERAQQAGCSAFFTKPVVTSDLLHFVRQHFEQPAR